MSGRRSLVDRLRLLRRLSGRVEVAQVARFGASLLSLLARTHVLVLHTTGRRTSLPRSTAVAFHCSPDGSLLVVGGAGGQRRTPDWVANLRATSSAAVTVDRATRQVTATELTGSERDAVWPELVVVWPRIATYERRAGRRPPVFRLVERGEGSALGA